MDGVSRIRDANGNLYVRYFYWDDGQLHRNYNFLDNDWDVQNPALLLASLFMFLPPSMEHRGKLVL